MVVRQNHSVQFITISLCNDSNRTIDDKQLFIENISGLVDVRMGKHAKSHFTNINTSVFFVYFIDAL